MFKLSKIFVLVALIVPCFLNAHFSTDDFKGSYIGWGNSIGCLGEVSVAVLFQATINDDGNGEINFISDSLLPLGTTIGNNQCDPEVPVLDKIKFKLNLFSRNKGYGTFVISDFPFEGNVLVFDFIATKRDGKVEKFILNETFGLSKNPTCATPIEPNPTPIALNLLFFERQEN